MVLKSVLKLFSKTNTSGVGIGSRVGQMPPSNIFFNFYWIAFKPKFYTMFLKCTIVKVLD